MSQPTLRQVGLTTLEEGSSTAAPYTAYWDTTYASAYEQLAAPNEAQMARIRHLGEFTNQITDQVIRGGETEAIASYPGLLKPGRPLGKAIRTWDESLGSFNSMKDGQGDLLRAAGLLIDYNSFDEQDRVRGVVNSNPRTVYSAFVSLANNSPLIHQRPGRDLFLAAQLVHKAAWIDESPERQSRLFRMADAMYERVCESASQWPSGKDRASEYRTDIRFHVWSTRLRVAVAKNQTRNRDTAFNALCNLMCGRAARFQYVHGQIMEIDGEIEQQAGHLFERFVSLAVRDTVLTDWVEKKESLDFEIRQAFPSEDGTPHGLWPKPSFDKVVQYYRPDGSVVTTPAQVKLGKHAVEMCQQKDYLPGIAFVRTKRLSLAQMNEAARGLERKYAARLEKTVQSDENLRAVQNQYSGLLVAA